MDPPVGPFRGTDGASGVREVAYGPKLIRVAVILAGAAVPVAARAPDGRTVGRHEFREGHEG